jgi:integrase
MPRQAEDPLPYNELAIKAAKARNEKPTEYKVAGVPGLLLRVEPSGAAAFYSRYHTNGQRRRIRLGSRGVMPPSEAKKRATEIALAVESGEDPYLSNRLERAEGKTLRELWDLYRADDHAKSEKTIAYYDGALRKFVFPVLGDQIANTVTPDAIASLLRQVRTAAKKEKRTTAPVHSARCAIGSLYRWAYKQRAVTRNPTIGLGFVYKAKPRERHVEADEIAKVWAGIDGEHGPTKRMRLLLKQLLVTGQRNSTVAGARVDELKTIDTVNPVWKVPKARMKNRRRDHLLPLSPLAADLFHQAIAMNNDSDFVFPAGRGEEEHFGQASVSRAMKRLCSKIGVKDLRIHDFRKAMTTWLVEQGVPYEVRTKITHQLDADPHSRNYDFSKLEKPMRDAMTRWAEYVVSCRSETTSNVVPMVQKRRA